MTSRDGCTMVTKRGLLARMAAGSDDMPKAGMCSDFLSAKKRLTLDEQMIGFLNSASVVLDFIPTSLPIHPLPSCECQEFPSLVVEEPRAMPIALPTAARWPTSTRAAPFAISSTAA